MQRSIESHDELNVNTLKFSGGARCAHEPLKCQEDTEQSGQTHTMSQRTLEAKQSLNNKLDVKKKKSLKMFSARRPSDRNRQWKDREGGMTERESVKMLEVVLYL